MNDAMRGVRLFATDVEETLLGEVSTASIFTSTWQSIEPDRRPLLVYNSGRSVRDLMWLVLEHKIPAPEFIIGGLGTEMHDPVDPRLAAEFEADISAGWDGTAVDRIVSGIAAVRLRPEEFLNPRKRSWYWPRASAGEVALLEARLRDAHLDVAVMYTASVFLDVIPRRAGKEHALAWLCRRVGVALENVVVAGATANNRRVYDLPGVRGIVVGNASAELFVATTRSAPFVARETFASGVLAGLEHFGVPVGVAHA